MSKSVKPKGRGGEICSPLRSIFQNPSPTRGNLLLSFFGGANRCKSPKCPPLVNKTEIKLWNLGSREGSGSRCRRNAGELRSALDVWMFGSKSSFFIGFITPTRFLNPCIAIVGLAGLSMGGNLTILSPVVVWEFFRIFVALSCNSCNLRFESSFRLALFCISIILLCFSLWALDSLLNNWMIEMSLEDCRCSILSSWTSRNLSKPSLFLDMLNLLNWHTVFVLKKLVLVIWTSIEPRNYSHFTRQFANSLSLLLRWIGLLICQSTQLMLSLDDPLSW